MADLPPYSSWLRHGQTCEPPPAVFADTRVTLFGARADRHAMQALVDALLTPVAGTALNYTCPIDMMLITFMDVARATSLVDKIGWIPFRECALWVPLLERKAGDLLPGRLVLWTPYIFINDAVGLVTGREMWGWPKATASIALASDTPDAPARYSCDTAFQRTFDPALQVSNGTLFSVDGTKPLSQSSSAWQSGEGAFAAICTDLLDGIGEALIAAIGLTPIIPAVALRQLRDSEDPTLACFQEIVNSPVEITHFGGGGRLNDTFTLSVTTCDSHQIIADLFGTAPQPNATTVPVFWAAWLAFDLEALSGNTIVRRA